MIYHIDIAVIFSGDVPERDRYYAGFLGRPLALYYEKNKYQPKEDRNEKDQKNPGKE